MTTYLLDRQIEALKEKFVKEGGWTENIFRQRLAYRQKQAGFGLIELLIVLAILAITLAGGVVVWEKKISPTPTTTPTPTLPETTQPTSIPSLGIGEEVQTGTLCSRESGIDTCPTGYICYWSWECPKGIQHCGPPTGDFLCHKKCQTDGDCPLGMPFCKELSLFRGDYGNQYRMCMK